MLIDDSLDNLAIEKIILEMAGYCVITASGGHEAIRLLSSMPPIPDLILLDMQMEKISGPSFIKILQQDFPKTVEEVPIVFLTGMDEVPTTLARGLIRKPIDVETFPLLVEKFIENEKLPR
jgi:CheY-like chemotaxis protein